MKKLTVEQTIESLYWYWQVRNWLEDQAYFRYPEEAAIGFLKGTHNADYMSNEIMWAVYQWRKINGYRVDDLEATVDVHTT